MAVGLRIISLPQVQSRGGDFDLHRMARDLTSLIEGDVRFGEHDRLLYATDASLYQVEPLGVVCPRTVDEAERVIEYCAKHELPVLPRGGGTSLAGQTVNRAIVVDFSAYCRRILEVNAQERFSRVEPGVVLDQLNAELAKHGLMFGPDVATSAHANIGGMIGNNSAGAHSIVYGRTVEHLLGADVMLADGAKLTLHEGAALRHPAVAELTKRIADVILPLEREIDARFPKTIRRVNGYNLDLMLQQLRASTPGTFDRVNLAHLICGSEGTLAVTLEARLNLVEAPRRRGLAIMSFDGVDQALRAVSAILETAPAAVELIDNVVISLARKNVECRRYVELLPTRADRNVEISAALYVAYFAQDLEQIRDRFDELKRRFPNVEMRVCTDSREMADAWALRKAGEPLLHGMVSEGKALGRKPITFIEDLAVPPKQLADFVAEFRSLVARHGTTAAYYAHASVGCLHIRPLVCIRNEQDRKAMQAIAEEATDLVVRYGGALSGEHGDGRARSHLLERFYGKPICDALRQIKAVFDPHDRLNPGNIVDPQPMLDRLRVKPAASFVEVPSIKTYFRYERDHGFAEAVEMCNGAGVCRKMKGGTMCPSYRATLDERHATRGRANALRLAITGQLCRQKPAWNDAETIQTLDLCLSCKACKSECPSNVDVARLKAEYMAQSFDARGGPPLGAKAFGRIRDVNRVGSALHPLANALSRLWPVKAMIGKCLSLHPKRELPRFGQSLYRWMSRRSNAAGAGRPAVVLFPDCFTVYNEPRIGRAAVQVLESLGYRVILPKLGCCGRAQISVGILRDALKVCRQTAIALMCVVQQENAVAVVGCEPSCISAIKDDWLDLDLGVDSASLHTLAEKTMLVEEFIEQHWSGHSIAANAFPSPGTAAARLSQAPILLHGHCHQKALWGVDTSAAILNRIFGDRLHIIDSGCCGMAGSFGYARHRYDISMRIGELSLFGPLRENPDAIITAPGISCRQQIRDGLGRTALHPVELIASVMT